MLVEGESFGARGAVFLAMEIEIWKSMPG